MVGEGVRSLLTQVQFLGVEAFISTGILPVFSLSVGLLDERLGLTCHCPDAYPKH